MAAGFLVSVDTTDQPDNVVDGLDAAGQGETVGDRVSHPGQCQGFAVAMASLNAMGRAHPATAHLWFKQYAVQPRRTVNRSGFPGRPAWCVARPPAHPQRCQ